ncbi:MAG: FtsH protease activity modulator HflK [Planctomycetes bacterium]|nr:FtsH protease activity modulator HflK [Planctomycetota bacterium]
MVFPESASGRRPPQQSLPIDPLLMLAPWAILGLMALYFSLGCFYTVAPYEQAVVMRFGKYQSTMMPGLHFKLPLADQVLKVSIEERSLRLPLTTVDTRNKAHEDETLMLTGDLNTASVEWTVQWKVTDPAQYLFRFPANDPDEFAQQLVTTVARTVMNRLVGDYSFDEVIGAARSEISHEARKATQEILDHYQCGITVPALQMQRVTPPEQVKPAFDRVNAAIQEKQKLENEAEAERNRLIPQALAAKDKAIREAQGYADRRHAESQGEIDALVTKYRAYQKAPDITRQRLYLEAMEEVLEGVQSKTIMDSDLKQIYPLLQLDR